MTALFKAMNHRDHRIWSPILLASLQIAARQLPPEIMADRHMVRLDRLISENQHREAYQLTSEISEFYEKHNLELPHEFRFKQARIASSLGLFKEAIATLHTYLNKTGKHGARYVDALQLLDRTEEKLKEAEAERKRMEAERRRVEAARKRHPDLQNRQTQAASVRLARDPLRSGGLGPEMVTVAKGGFQYPYTVPTIVPGNEYGRDYRRVQRVEIDQPFAISKHETTRGEFRRFVKATRYRTEAEQRGSKCRQVGGDRVKNASWKRLRIYQTDSHPVVCVSRRDAMAFAEWLSRETGHSYRLPTLVEWQYAARAGSDFAMLDSGRDSEGKVNHNHCGRANLGESSRHDWTRCVDGVEHTAQVGSFPSNAIGLHDMIGNVGEWVSSCDIGYIRPELLLQNEEVKELLLRVENDHHCEAHKQLAAGGAYVGGDGAIYVIYDDSFPPLLFDSKDDKSTDSVGFRLVKDFELKKNTEKTGGVIE